MAAPSASGTGIINKPTAYGATSQVTSTNLNAHVDNAVFNANAVSSTINVGDDGKGLFVVDGSITTAKTSFLGTVDVTANSTVRILSKQSDGQYDSVTPSGDVTMSQAGAFTIEDNAVTGSMILQSSLQISKLASIADQTIVGNNDGSSSSPEALTASEVIGVLGTSLINPTSISGSTNTIVLSNGLTLKFGSHTTTGSDKTQTVNFSDHGGNFSNDCIYFNMYFLNNTTGDIVASTNEYVRTQSASSVAFNAFSAVNGYVYKFIAIGY